jgi:4-amino-4-deoxy-L-arabinose transferase-like glycosyltransferase
VREGLSRPLWLAVIIVAFCVPLFVGLDRTDMENDEAIYSYAVDSILRSGDWLNPLLSPFSNHVFLEKPPLKFWIVAAPIATRIFPHTHWAMRIWDALFGAMAFLYVFLIGRRLAGPVCGFVGVFTLFIYGPLLFEHGLRNNNMEAPLVLSYCGGLFHYLAWATTTDNTDNTDVSRAGRSARTHAALVMLYFFLGFMTKFVAIAFLPLVLGAVTLLHPPTLRKALGAWRLWAALVACFIVLAAPWFIYEYYREGTGFLRVIFGEHVYRRFTTSLDPGHIHPWNYYFIQLYLYFDHLGMLWLIGVGGVLLIAQTIRQWRLEMLLVVCWFALPLTLMSIGTSKLHHYLYPFLPPIALAAGFGPAWLLTAGRSYVDRAVDVVQQRWIAGRGWTTRVRPVLLVLAAIGVVVAMATVILGRVDIEAGGVTLFRNSHAARPLVIALVLATLAGQGAFATRVLLPGVLLIAILPVNEYENVLKRVVVESHPVRTAGDCLLRVRSRELAAGNKAPGIYAVGGERWFLHSYYYYLHEVGGWDSSPTLDEPKAVEGLFTPGLQRPMMLNDEAYQALKVRHAGLRNVPVMKLRDVLLLAPGPYAPCVPTPAQ